jgi:hypothetical protein
MNHEPESGAIYRSILGGRERGVRIDLSKILPVAREETSGTRTAENGRQSTFHSGWSEETTIARQKKRTMQR